MNSVTQGAFLVLKVSKSITYCKGWYFMCSNYNQMQSLEATSKTHSLAGTIKFPFRDNKIIELN